MVRVDSPLRAPHAAGPSREQREALMRAAMDANGGDSGSSSSSSSQRGPTREQREALMRAAMGSNGGDEDEAAPATRAAPVSVRMAGPLRLLPRPSLKRSRISL
jgi:hypothetical protein